MAKVLIRNRQKLMRIPPRVIRKTVSGILESESALQNPETSILLLDDRRISELNETYLKRQGPTDVISFPQYDDDVPPGLPQLLGDVVISVETAIRQAPQHGKTPGEEIVVLLIHGVLHLLGYDHEQSPEEGRRMRRRERSFYKKVMQEPDTLEWCRGG